MAVKIDIDTHRADHPLMIQTKGTPVDVAEDLGLVMAALTLQMVERGETDATVFYSIVSLKMNNIDDIVDALEKYKDDLVDLGTEEVKTE